FDNYTKYEYSNDKKIIFHAIELGKLYNSLGNFELASQILNKAIELSKNSDNELLLCEAFLNQAFCLQNKNEFETALKLLENAKNIAKSLSAKKQLGEIEFRIANVLIKENNFLPSIDHLILSKEIAKENGANELILSSKLLLAQSFFTQNNFAETQKILKNLFELDFKEDFPVLLSNAYTLFGNLNFSLNKFELALESFEKTLKILRKFGSLETNSTTLYKIGKINFYLCNYENAFASFEESLLLAEQCGNITTQIEIFTEIGELYRLTGNFKKSLDYLNKAISGLEKAPSDKLKAQIYHNLGKLFAELGNPLEALNFYDKSIVLSDSNNYHDLCSSNRIGIARVSRFQKEQTEITLSKIEEALRIANEFGCLFEETIALYELGELYLEQKQNDVALENFQKSIAIAERIRLDFYIAKNYLKMGFVYINEENFNRAVLCLDGAQKVFTHLPLGRLQLEIFYFEIYFAKQQKQFYKALSVCEAAIKTVEKMADTLEDTKNREKYLSGFEELYRERFLFFLKANDQEKLYQKFRNLKIKSWTETYEKYREKVLKGIVEVEEEHQNTTEPIKISLNAEHYLAKLLQISQTLNVIRNEEKLLQTTLDLLIETVGAEKGVIFLKDEQTGELLPKATGKSEFETVQDAFQISQTVLEDVVSGGKPIVSLNAKNDNRYKQKQSIVKYQITSFICVPLSFDGKIIGTVYVDKRGNEQALNNDDLNFIVGFASQAAIAIENARLTAKLKTENQNLKAIVSEKFHFEGIIGNSKPMQKIFEKLTKVIESDSTVVVSGESGTGKELIAKAIHFNGARKDKPFIAVNCSELPETLENELFGHRKGSFTGAVFDKKGLFEEASGGTIFLDEITNTSLGFQAKLLRVLQEREVRRIGETIPRKIDVRVIAATNIDLFQATKEGSFREDLYYRLNVIQINLPQLSKREGDVETLVNFFLEKNSKRRGKTYKISQKALKMLVSYDFPGNVRQLENLIEQAVVMCNNETIEESDLPELNPSLQQKKSGFSTYNLNEIEKQIISEVLKKCNWEFKKTAQTLGISRTTLYSKVEKHNLQRN
ncbi:sigma 54-interacting transcriptional regulator, partial [bacterium]|nr:sigma 54-interacting transcriptional regulator [bacterium]